MGVEERREYDLAILIILVVLCWPAAIIYYFTRPVVRVDRSAQQAQLQTITRICPQCGRVINENAKFCPYCGKELVS